MIYTIIRAITKRFEAHATARARKERERKREKRERPVRQLNDPQINYSSLKPNGLSRQAEENEKRDAVATFTSARTARKYLRELARHLLPVLLCPSSSHGSSRGQIHAGGYD